VWLVGDKKKLSKIEEIQRSDL